MSKQKDFGTVRDASPIVRTTLGIVSGEGRDGVAVFRSIPYGAECDGESRFLPPRPAKAWAGVLNCAQRGVCAAQIGAAGETMPAYFHGGHPERVGACAQAAENGPKVLNVSRTENQSPDGLGLRSGIAQQSENCLVVNVLTPGLDDAKRPVVVYIHGGGFATGSSNLVLATDDFAKEENIVVVGLNHRLNVFGYLYLGAFDTKYAASGLAGMQDLVLGLQWVRDNIAAFGGDPEKVTLMGESGGSMKVNTLLNMPHARGLFRAAIMESGSGYVGALSREAATETAREVLRQLGVQPNELHRLAELPTQQILAAADPFLHRLAPVADEENLQYCSEERFEPEAFAAKVPVIIGASEDELAAGCFGLETPEISWDNLPQELLRYFREHSFMCRHPETYTPQKIDDILAVFQQHNPKRDDAEHLYWKIVSMCSSLGGNAYYHALEHAAKNSAPVYAYVNAFDAPQIMSPGKRFSWHVSDLALQMRIVLYPICEAASKTMGAAWGAFIRTGNPSTESLTWPAFDAQRRQVMVLDDASHVETDPQRALFDVLY